jgi:hypothetical protein
MRANDNSATEDWTNLAFIKNLSLQQLTKKDVFQTATVSVELTRRDSTGSKLHPHSANRTFRGAKVGRVTGRAGLGLTHDGAHGVTRPTPLPYIPMLFRIAHFFKGKGAKKTRVKILAIAF